MNRDVVRSRRRDVQHVAWLMVVVFAVACGEEEGRALTIRERVSLQCSSLSRELERAAQQYEDIARLQRSGRVLDEGFKGRADAGLEFGFTFNVRIAHSRHLSEAIQFCILSKKGYEPVLDSLSLRASIAIDEFVKAGKFLAEPPEENVEIMAHAMRELATIGYAMETMPMKR